MNTIIYNDAQETKVLKELPKWLITLKSNDNHKYNLRIIQENNNIILIIQKDRRYKNNTI